MKHDAILALNSSIVRVVTKRATGQTFAYDENGNEVSWDADAVATKEAELIAALKLEDLRVERNRLIAETDWWDMSDTATMTDAQKTYRQSLRDITKTYKSMDDAGFSWPTKPS
tara:strand:- start:666 stop:1007 length:342 start_codon:yes stop_codon:yes gene_type:complete